MGFRRAHNERCQPRAVTGGGGGVGAGRDSKDAPREWHYHVAQQKCAGRAFRAWEELTSALPWGSEGEKVYVPCWRCHFEPLLAERGCH